MFEDVFETTADTGELTVRIDWRIDQGKAAVELTSPGGASVNWTSAETGGPQGQGEETIAAEDGTWEIRIPTWRGADGSSPSGHVEVRVVD